MDHNRDRPGVSDAGKKNNGNLGSSIARGVEELEGIDLERMRERFGELSERAVEAIRARPGTSLLIALGAGYVIGRMLRA